MKGDFTAEEADQIQRSHAQHLANIDRTRDAYENNSVPAVDAFGKNRKTIHQSRNRTNVVRQR
jgi:hypothetical protein